jgi:hypothetical protein
LAIGLDIDHFRGVIRIKPRAHVDADAVGVFQVMDKLIVPPLPAFFLFAFEAEMAVRSWASSTG